MCNDMPCANTLQGEAPVYETNNNPSPIPNRLNPNDKKKNVVNLGFKFRGFFELQYVFGIFFIVKNIFLTIIYTFLN